MLPFKIQRPNAMLARRLAPVLALVGFLPMVIGLPVSPAFMGGKDRSQPFPCMHRQCGCQTAADCWQGCCCFSNRQKLAWAARNRVQPPPGVAAAAQLEAKLAKGKSCCEQSEAKKASCCSPEGPSACCEAEPARAEGKLAIEGRRCQGTAELWLIVSAAAPLAAPLRHAPESPISGEAPALAESLVAVSFAPATPPPKA